MASIVGLCTLASCNAIWGVSDLDFSAVGTGGTATEPVGGGGQGTTSSTTTTTGSLTTSTTSGAGGGAGAGTGGSGAGGGGAGGEAAGFCDEPGLVACYRFEGDLSDGSPNGNDAQATSPSFAPAVDGQGLIRFASSDVTVPPDPSFGVSALTIEAWVQATVLPASGSRAVIFDHDGHHSFYITSTEVVCRGTTPTGAVGPIYGPGISALTWTHLACTVDATGIRLYVNGSEVATGTGGALLDDVSPHAIGIGQNAPSGEGLLGALDSMRIFGLARSAELICQAAGLAECS